MNDSEGIGLVWKPKHVQAEVNGSIEESEEILFTKGVLSVINRSKGNPRLGISEPCAEWAIFRGVDCDEIAGFCVRQRVPDHGRVDGWMETERLQLHPRALALGSC